MGLAIATMPINEDAPPRGTSTPGIVATDGELLMRFVRDRDEAAFAQIAERHGRLVWVVCRQVLGHQQDVEDAFQATFLIFAQQARSIRASDSAAAWLYRVAQRTALAARRKRARRREENLSLEPPADGEELPGIHDREMLYILMDELRALPEPYQTPLILRYFEGQSRREIAEQTDSTLAQIQGRLVRGRRLLRSRVVRRGVSLSLATGAVSAASASAHAAVTPALIAETAASCLAFKFTPSGTASGTSPAVAELAKEGMTVMSYATITKSVAILAAVLLASGIVWAAQQGGGDGADEAASVGLALQTDPQEAAELFSVPVLDLAMQSAPAESAAQQEGSPEQQPSERDGLNEAISDLKLELDVNSRNRAVQAMEIELLKIEESLLRQELDEWHKALTRLKMPPELQSAHLVDVRPATDEAIEAIEERRDTRNRLLDLAVQRIADIKDELREQLIRAAQTSDEMELREMERRVFQDRLEEMLRLRAQVDFPQPAARPTAAPSVPASLAQLAPAPSSAEQFQQVVKEKEVRLRGGLPELHEENAELNPQVMMKFEIARLRLGLAELQAENAKLKRQIEATRSQSSGLPPGVREVEVPR